MNVVSVIRRNGDLRDDELDDIDADDRALENTPELERVVKAMKELSEQSEWNDFSRQLFVMCFKYSERYDKTITARNLRREAALRARISAKTDLLARTRRLVHDPSSSIPARLLYITSVSLSIIGTVAFVMQTIPQWSPDLYPRLDRVWFLVEVPLAVFFTFEFLLRWGISGQPLGYWKSVMSWVDMLSCLPFYLELVISSASSLRAVRVLRLTRVFRVLKVTRASGSAQQVLSDVVKSALPALVFPVTFMLAALVFLAGIMYIVEKGTYDSNVGDFLINSSDCEWNPPYLWGRQPCKRVPSRFISIPDALWWAVQTLLAVGYGDIVPWTWMGRLVNTVCLLFGMVFWSIPLTIVGNCFYRAIMAFSDRRREAQLAALRDAGRIYADTAHGGISYLVLEKQLGDTPRVCRKAMSVLEVTIPKLYRHISVCLEQFNDLRTRVPEDTLLEKIRKHNEGLKKRPAGMGLVSGIAAAISTRRATIVGSEPRSPLRRVSLAAPKVVATEEPKQWNVQLSPRRSALRRREDESPTGSPILTFADVLAQQERVSRTVSSTTAPRSPPKPGNVAGRTWGGEPVSGERTRKFHKRAESRSRSRSHSASGGEQRAAVPTPASPAEVPAPCPTSSSEAEAVAVLPQRPPVTSSSSEAAQNPVRVPVAHTVEPRDEGEQGAASGAEEALPTSPVRKVQPKIRPRASPKLTTMKRITAPPPTPQEAVTPMLPVEIPKRKAGGKVKRLRKHGHTKAADESSSAEEMAVVSPPMPQPPRKRAPNSRKSSVPQNSNFLSAPVPGFMKKGKKKKRESHEKPLTETAVPNI
eukprot:TRINITY_DN24980_c0_g1_i1.p1 TRINITY_DN24980_c0_g1~~TRINITY_DN24980_c0_g1_i1.p1  ORF type:complete len:813 (-),score=96.81 TRINITY_DN24980_c0_g1_i1:194-2632(-)